jgi:carbamoyltransferase
MTGVGRGNQIEVMDTVHYPHSLGIFYTAMTQYLGFPHYGDEYKVMGLAPYGKPVYMSQMRSLIKTLPNGLFELRKKYFQHFRKGVAMSWEGGLPEVGQLWTDEVKINLMPPRQKNEEVVQWHMDLAASVQKRCEEVIYHVLNHLHEKTKLDTLCIAGGVAQNSVANGKLTDNTPFKKIYIPPAGHDAGTSIGSALYLYNQLLKQSRRPAMKVAGLGSRFRPEDIEAALKANNLEYQRLQGDAFYNKIVDCLANSGVVGWFQGRAEFGPRALGYRSILADPRRKDARDLLNKKIKKRESFRPFAPSILQEYVGEYFEKVDEVPFMEKVFKIKADKHKVIPAVTHVDGTGRLQTVDKEVNLRYHRLIDTFREKTGVPILLNTSFNENEPIVNTPQEALDCYLRTSMDMIVLDDYIVERKA